MPAGMKVIPTTGKIFTAAWQMMGFESFCLSLYDQPGLVQALFERITALQVAGYERMCALSTVGGFWFSDDIAHGAGAFIAPTVLRRYIFPVYRRMVQIAHQAGRIAIFHSDGDLWPVIDDIIACGFDALHPIEPKAMDIVKVQAYARGRLALVGNIDIDFPFL
jgi:uroporphyrinogen decarboxylase